MKEEFYFLNKEQLDELLKNQGRFICLANTDEVIWAPLDATVTHEQIAQSKGKDPRQPENQEWFEQYVRFRFDLQQNILWWTFALNLDSIDFLKNKRLVRQYYNLGFDTANKLASLYPELKGLQMEIADVENLYNKYACVKTFKQINGNWELQEMSTEEELKGTMTLKEAQLKHRKIINYE